MKNNCPLCKAGVPLSINVEFEAEDQQGKAVILRLDKFKNKDLIEKLKLYQRKIIIK